jgi:hypothetical protein
VLAKNARADIYTIHSDIFGLCVVLSEVLSRTELYSIVMLSLKVHFVFIFPVI